MSLHVLLKSHDSLDCKAQPTVVVLFLGLLCFSSHSSYYSLVYCIFLVSLFDCNLF